MYIYRTWITKNGVRIYAKDYGLKAFRFWVLKYKKQIFTVYQVHQSAQHLQQQGGASMAKTKSSTHGKQQKKIVTVSGYKKSGGIKVKPHRRSTPN